MKRFSFLDQGVNDESSVNSLILIKKVSGEFLDGRFCTIFCLVIAF